MTTPPLPPSVFSDPDEVAAPNTWWGGCCGCLLLLLSAAIVIWLVAEFVSWVLGLVTAPG